MRASERVLKIVALPGTKGAIDCDGASFDLNGVIIVFEHDKEEEPLTVLHEIGHVLDPGYQANALAAAFKRDSATAPKQILRLLAAVGNDNLERFAELVAWHLAGVKQIKHFPRSLEVVCDALEWNN